ncbi:MAG: hypothetical protein R3F55_18510 [Alphaproteobacteria bacterium]
MPAAQWPRTTSGSSRFYRRIIVFLIAVGAVVFEALFLGEELWMFLFGGLALWAGYDFFLSGKYGRRPPKRPQA